MITREDGYIWYSSAWRSPLSIQKRVQYNCDQKRSLKEADPKKYLAEQRADYHRLKKLKPRILLTHPRAVKNRERKQIHRDRNRFKNYKAWQTWYLENENADLAQIILRKKRLNPGLGLGQAFIEFRRGNISIEEISEIFERKV